MSGGSRRADRWDYLTDDQRARLFRHFTPEQLEWSMRSRGLDVVCEDPATLRRVARIHARAIIAAEESDGTGQGGEGPC